jgi:hypothetical protein
MKRTPLVNHNLFPGRKTAGDSPNSLRKLVMIVSLTGN